MQGSQYLLRSWKSGLQYLLRSVVAYCICRGHENLAYSICTRPPPLPPRAGKSRRRTDGRTGIGANLGRSWNKTWTPRMTKATQRILKNPLKIHSRGVLGISQIRVGTLPKLPRAKRNHMWPTSQPKSRENPSKVAPKSSLWDPSGTQRLLTSRPGAKKVLPQRLPEAVILQFLMKIGCDQHFPVISHRFQVDFPLKSDWKNYAFFTAMLVFSQHGDPHDSTYFTYRKQLLYVLLFVFSQKKSWKSRSTKTIPKNIKKLPQAGQK